MSTTIRGASALTRLSNSTNFQAIAELIEQHFDALNTPMPFIPGKTRIPLNVPTYSAAEVIEALDSLMSTWVTMGKKVQAFEQMWAEYIGFEYGVMTNSGSSANLLALSALGLQPGVEVITPALTWATTVFPIAQVGAVPVLVDVDREAYNISPEAIEQAITPRTRAIMPVHLLGNPCDMDAIWRLADRYSLYVIEDACEAHGAEYDGRKVGSFGHLSTFSFFFSHHISTIEGGMVLTNEGDWADRLRSMRAHGWIREMSNKEAIAQANPNVDPRFLFATVGYNMRPTEIGGAFGIHQVPRLEGLVEHRRSLAAYFNDALAEYQDWLMLPKEAPNTRHSYFAYALTVKEGAPF
ncbi:MAG: DegT/DnrJ/EryC1/StrS family aminotransferase, partial [Dehalococcoidia bacterium]|nr:DegT/DnrJ/EryC1/StrS family aminotransferase [Dehalococcoidia bacterium]